MRLIITIVIIALTSSPVYAWFGSPSGFGGSSSGFGTPAPVVEEPEIVEPEVEDDIEVFPEPEISPETGEWLNENGFLSRSQSGFSPVEDVYQSPAEVIYTTPELITSTIAEIATVEPVTPAPNKDIIIVEKAPNEIHDTWFDHSSNTKTALPATHGNGLLWWLGLLTIVCGIGVIIIIERGNDNDNTR